MSKSKHIYAHGRVGMRGESLVTLKGKRRDREFKSMGLEVEGLGSEVPTGRFGKLFEELPPFDPGNRAIHQVAEKMRETDEEDRGDSAIPLAFAFLGQFIDHDITFDPITRLDERVDPMAVRNFRTPLTDLDNVYGAGPDASRHLYDTEGTGKEPSVSEHRLPFRLLVNLEAGNRDLPRNSQHTAIIGDPRNDENLLVSQLHRAFLGFHNYVVQHLLEAADSNPPPNKDLFEESRRIVTLHYLHIVTREFLPLIIGETLVKDIFDNGRKFFQWESRSQSPFIPVEFSGAAYRFGHTLIRAKYDINEHKTKIPLFELPFFGTVDGQRQGPGAEFSLDWARFVDFGSSASKPQLCRSIDAKVTSELFELPFISSRQDPPASLPERNMRRGRVLGLPSGQAVARRMGEAPLSNTQLGIEDIEGLEGHAPLWFYILKESKLTQDGEHLGPVGGRIVGETLIGLAQHVFDSYESDQTLHGWSPTLPNRHGEIGSFTLADLVSSSL